MNNKYKVPEYKNKKKIPLSKFQGMFRIYEDYPPEYIRKAVSGCFPEKKVPFDGLDRICIMPDELYASLEDIRKLTQKQDTSREEILLDRIPPADKLEHPRARIISIVESEFRIRKKHFIRDDIVTSWQRVTRFIAKDSQYRCSGFFYCYHFS